VLSKHDFAKELGKNLLIYPFSIDSLDHSSYALHAHKYAWELDTKNSALATNGDKEFIAVPPKKTVLVLTKESISLQHNLSGICCSGVSNAAKGLLICTTPIKCGWIGRLIVTVYNTTDNQVNINIGEKIAVLLIDRLHSKTQNSIQNQNMKTLQMLTALIGESISGLEDEISPTNTSNVDHMKTSLINSENYKQFRASQPKQWWKFVLSLIGILVLIIVIGKYIGYDKVLSEVISVIVGLLFGWWGHSFFS
jgi:deoxycytidine triphosphate deaminase